MRKSLLITLVLALVFGISSLAFAATPFSDVPAKHWSYAAVKKLAADGIIEGDGSGAFKGDKILTRYEFAVMVAKVIEKEAKVTAEQKALINKLAGEYKDELAGLGVKVKALEDKVSALELSGAARVRYDLQRDASTYDDRHINLDINYSYRVNADWIVKVENEFQRKFNNPNAGDSAGDNAIADNEGIDSQTEQLYITGPLVGATTKLGKYHYKSPYGLVFDGRIMGAEATFGNVVRTTLISSNTDADDGFKGIDVAWAVGKDTNVGANYQRIDVNNVSKNYCTLGLDTKIADDLIFTAAAAKSNNNTNNKAYYTQLQYKAAESTVVGSGDLFVNYRKTPTNAVYYTDKDTEDRILDINFKGIRVGFDYVPTLNSKLTVWYMSGKDADTGLTNIKIYRGQIEVYF
ncbi:MAG: S-layer protein [Firmicutes bacterium]|nr:S-layer protein [Bacillota bacterium]